MTRKKKPLLKFTSDDGRWNLTIKNTEGWGAEWLTVDDEKIVSVMKTLLHLTSRANGGLGEVMEVFVREYAKKYPNETINLPPDRP